MKKIKDTDLVEDITEMIDDSETAEDAANGIVEFLRDYQDAGGMKVCQH